MATKIETQVRLYSLIEAACPCVSKAVGEFGVSASVTFTPAAGATANQVAAAQAVINGFDWSDSATDTWIAQQNPERTAVRATMAQAVIDCNAYAAINNPTAAQTSAFLKKAAVMLKNLIQYAGKP